MDMKNKTYMCGSNNRDKKNAMKGTLNENSKNNKA